MNRAVFAVEFRRARLIKGFVTAMRARPGCANLEFAALLASIPDGAFEAKWPAADWLGTMRHGGLEVRVFPPREVAKFRAAGVL